MKTVAPTWPLAPELRRRVSVRWPERYEWPIADRWVGTLRRHLAAAVPLTTHDIPQTYEGVVAFELELDGRRQEVAIDYFDRDRLLDEVARRFPLVFKMQFSVAGYGQSHVIPGGYVPAHRSLYRYLPGLRAAQDAIPPRIDVYGRFTLAGASEVRRTAVTTLREQHRFGYEGSLVVRPYPTFLREAALSRVCIDLPGNGDLCHRLIDYLGIGCVVVRPQALTRLHVELTDGLDIRYADDLGDGLVSVCGQLVDDDECRRAQSAAARAFYDRYLTPSQLAGYYLDACLRQLED